MSTSQCAVITPVYYHVLCMWCWDLSPGLHAFSPGSLTLLRKECQWASEPVPGCRAGVRIRRLRCRGKGTRFNNSTCQKSHSPSQFDVFASQPKEDLR